MKRLRFLAVVSNTVYLHWFFLIAVLISANGNADVIKILFQGDTQKITDQAPNDFLLTMENTLTDSVTNSAAFILQMGDITEDNKVSCWQVAQEGWYKLDGQIPYVLNIGNNDGNGNNFCNYFPLSKYNTWPSFVDNYDDHKNVAHHFNAGGVDWLVISARYNPDAGVMTWAENLVAGNPDKKVIFISHAANSNGSEVNMLKNYENVVFVLCGHTASRHELLTGNNGNNMGWVKTCHHSAVKDSYYCVAELDTVEGTAYFRYYSPQYGKYWDDPTAPYHDGQPADSPWTWTGFDFGGTNTSLNIPEGASARGDNPPDETVDEAFDGDDQTKWLDFSPTGSWLQWRYPGSTAPTVKQYAITSANDHSDRDPMDWNLLGSNDHGYTWDVLDSRTGEIFTERFQKRSFFVSDPGDYNIYRLNITAVYNQPTTANSVQLAEFELSPCAGLADFNCNGTISLDDFSYMAGVWLIDDPMADVADPAGQVDVYDMLVLAQEWLMDPSMDAAVAYWKLDETAGDLASDYSRNGHPGTLINMDDSDWVPGLAGNALDFDGVNDYVASDVCVALAGRNVTVSAWMKAPALNPAMQFMIAINSAAGDNKLMFGTQAGTATLSFADSEPLWRDTTATVIDNTWHHTAFVLDDIADTVNVYVDGAEVLSFTSTVSIADTDLLSLAQEYDAGLTTGDFYTGLLDDVKVYDYALNETQIRRLYDPSALLAHWQLDEITGSVASDSSLYGYDGTLVNMDDSDWVEGNTGNALDFDGVNDHVAVDDICTGMAGRDITVSAWVKAPAVSPANQFIISINSSNGDDNKLLMGTPAGTDTLSLGTTAWHHTTATVIDNTWHHVAYVLEDSSDTITVYVDGSGVLSFASTVSVVADDVFSLAQEYDAGMITGDFYSGQLDDVRIYEYALSEAEIATLAQ